jgi:hypothetical protein
MADPDDNCMFCNFKKKGPTLLKSVVPKTSLSVPQVVEQIGLSSFQIEDPLSSSSIVKSGLAMDLC